jgi:hypothetical protein
LAFEKKVSRRKGETIGGRYRSNGYVLNQPNSLVGPKAATVATVAKA